MDAACVCARLGDRMYMKLSMCEVRLQVLTNLCVPRVCVGLRASRGARGGPHMDHLQWTHGCALEMTFEST